MSDKTHIFELFDPGKYIQAFELEDREHTVTITKIEGQRIEGEEGRSAKKPVLFLEGWPRPLVLNKTNAKTLIALYGPDYRQWPGKRFTMFPTVVKFGKEDVDAIRFRKRVPPAPAAQQRAERPALSIPERIAAVKKALRETNTLAGHATVVKNAQGLIGDLAKEPAELLDDLNLAIEARRAEIEEAK